MEPLPIDEILDETNQMDVNARQKHWLITEVCISPPFILHCALVVKGTGPISRTPVLMGNYGKDPMFNTVKHLFLGALNFGVLVF